MEPLRGWEGESVAQGGKDEAFLSKGPKAELRGEDTSNAVRSMSAQPCSQREGKPSNQKQGKHRAGTLHLSALWERQACGTSSLPSRSWGSGGGGGPSVIHLLVQPSVGVPSAITLHLVNSSLSCRSSSRLQSPSSTAPMVRRASSSVKLSPYFVTACLFVCLPCPHLLLVSRISVSSVGPGPERSLSV